MAIWRRRRAPATPTRCATDWDRASSPRARTRPPSMAALATPAPAAGGSGVASPALKWWNTCGDPVCRAPADACDDCRPRRMTPALRARWSVRRARRPVRRAERTTPRLPAGQSRYAARRIPRQAWAAASRRRDRDRRQRSGSPAARRRSLGPGQPNANGTRFVSGLDVNGTGPAADGTILDVHLRLSSSQIHGQLLGLAAERTDEVMRRFLPVPTRAFHSPPLLLPNEHTRLRLAQSLIRTRVSATDSPRAPVRIDCRNAVYSAGFA